LKLNFELADKFFKNYLHKTTGIITKDQKRRNDKAKGSKPFDKGRDPISAKDSMDGVISSFSWSNHLDKAELFRNWENVVGKDSGEASNPEDLQGGVLSVKCRSTAWATQLRLLEKDILRRINTDFPNLEVVEIKFFGPNAPSWKKGSRSVPGRGPRDTYG
jgi:predicted nucleic acid-binding Zn ribbon protein